MEYRNEMCPGKDDKSCDTCCKECNFVTGISLPLEIEPVTRVGEIQVESCGDPEVKKICTEDCTHKIIITQSFFVKVPVCYKIKTTIGKCDSDCKNKD